MRWKISIFLTIALVTASRGQKINIDLDVGQHLNPVASNSSEGNNNDRSAEHLEEPGENISVSEDSTKNSGDKTIEASLDDEHSGDLTTDDSVSVTGSNDRSEGIPNGDGIVETNFGAVQGHPWKDSPDILSFIDIPYGHITTLFQEPSLPIKWETVLDNTEHTKRCPQLQTNAGSTQLEVAGDLDCLTLSIFSHKDVTNASVLFHIHDGNFVSGSGDPLIYGPEYLVSKGIILILPNYRLGPLGFLCLQNEIAPGNAALRDLTLALNWTKDNIAAFGGNPDNIVVSGEGSSGALAGYLALSPSSREYISKVITESGSVISHWAIDRHPNQTATELEEMIRDANPDTTFNENFYEEIDMHILLLDTYGEHFRPCIDNYTNPFMTQTPWYILHEQKIDIPFMLGTASHAGLHETMDHVEHSLSILNENFASFLPDDLVFEEGEEEKVAEQVKAHYFGEETIDKDNLEKLAEFFTDALYLGPAIRAARVLVEAGATVYYYEFAFVGDFNKELVSLGEQAKTLNMSARGDIIGYLFTQEEHQLEPGSVEEKMVELMTNLWTNFIENGKPVSNDVEWNKLISTKEAENEEYLWIGSEPEAKKGIYVDRQQLWGKIYEAHFIERNVGRTITSRSPTIAIATICLLGLLPRSFN